MRGRCGGMPPQRSSWPIGVMEGGAPLRQCTMKLLHLAASGHRKGGEGRGSQEVSLKGEISLS